MHWSRYPHYNSFCSSRYIPPRGAQFYSIMSWRNWVFVTKSDFLIPITFSDPQVANPHASFFENFANYTSLKLKLLAIALYKKV